LSAADITFGTLESALSTDGTPQQPFGENFAADPRVLPGLVAAGFDVLSLGNNHVGDYGPRSLVETVRLVRDAGMLPVGAGANDDRAHRPAIVERNGVRFGFYAFNGRGETPRATARSPGAVRLRMAPYDPFSESDLARVERDVRVLATRVDVVIVLPHWGQQYTHRQNPDQRRVARALVEAGADAVIGSHPHWVQGVQAHRSGYIAYSLGNFIFSQNIHLPQTRQNVTVEMTFWGTQLKRVELVPGRIEDDFAARFLSWRSGREILEDVWRNSARSFRLDDGIG
jgi:poly-gamma-glutamate synthesis protein (capsule biosynthesis protein)